MFKIMFKSIIYENVLFFIFYVRLRLYHIFHNCARSVKFDRYVVLHMFTIIIIMFRKRMKVYRLLSH